MSSAVGMPALSPAIPTETVPTGSPTAVTLVTVRKDPTLVAVPAFAPVTVSVKAAPAALVPTTVKLIPASLPEDKIVICWATAFVTDPLEATAPPITNAASSATSAAAEIPSASASTNTLALASFVADIASPRKVQSAPSRTIVPSGLTSSPPVMLPLASKLKV